jgi:hypothetical protein
MKGEIFFVVDAEFFPLAALTPEALSTPKAGLVSSNS